MIARKVSVAASIIFVAVRGAAYAHSFPASESPAAGQTIIGTLPQVAITYDAPIEKLFASLEVDNAAGANQASGPAQVGADGVTLSVPVNKLAPGDYTVKWRVVCVDTHHTEGSYSFSVGAAP
jgi:methionine-rich copper-binding protein CopC